MIIYVAEGEGVEIVQQSDAGLVVTPGDVRGIADAAKALLREPAMRERLGRNGRRAAEARFDRTDIADRFIDFLAGSLE